MKKIYLFIFSIITLSQIEAQTYTLTQTNTDPIVGDSYGSLLVDTNSTPLPINISGPGSTWDIMSLTFADSIVAINTYSTAASATNSANYPGTNLVQTDSTTITYFKSSANKLELLGVDAGFFDLNYNTNAATLANYPMALGYTDTDLLVGGTITVPQASLSGPFTGTAVTSVDGSGSLSLNGGTPFTNCLRVKMVQNMTFDLAFGTISGTIEQSSYNFYHSSSKFPIFSVNYSHVVTTGLQTIDQTQAQASVISNITVGVKENLKNDIIFKAYPNPANNQVGLHFVLANKESYIIEITNTLGQIVKTISMPNLQPGVYNESINTSDLSSGMYTIKVSGKNTQGTEKLMIQK